MLIVFVVSYQLVWGNHPDTKMFLAILYLALPLVGKLLASDFCLYIAS